MAAAKQGFDASETLHSALKKIMLAMFHDTLPGSCIRDAEVQTVQTLGGVISDLEDLRLKAMRRLVSGLEPTRPDVYSILAYNPLPYAVEGVFECEFMLSDQDYSENYHEIEVEENGKKIPSQAIKERSNIPIEWRKRVAFHARLEPFSAHKFECTERLVQKTPRDVRESCKTEWRGGNVSVKFGKNGALESLKLGEKEYLGGEIKLSVYGDTEDSWGMRLECLERLGDFERDFELMNKSECSEWTGGQDVSSPVRITEDGEVFTRVETLLVCNRSAAVLTWTLYKFCDYVDLQVRIYNNEKNKLLKLRVPVAASEYIRQIPFGCEPITEGGAENAMLGYCAATGENGTFLICNDGVFSASCENGELALSLLRSVPYTAHPIGDRKVVPCDRFSPRMDQGEHVYSFRFIPDCNLRLASRRAQEFSEPPYVLNMSVSKRTGDKPDSPFKLSEGGAVVVAMRAENDGYLVRLANECGEEQVQTITAGNLNSVLRFKSFEVKTVRIGKTIRECEQMEW